MTFGVPATYNHQPFCNCFECTALPEDKLLSTRLDHADLVPKEGDIIQAQGTLRMYWLGTSGKYKDFVKGTTLKDYPVIRADKSFLYLKGNTFVDIGANYKIVDHVGLNLIRDAQIIFDEQAKQSAKPVVAVAAGAKQVVDSSVNAIKEAGSSILDASGTVLTYIKWIAIVLAVLVIVVGVAYSINTAKSLKA